LTEHLRNTKWLPPQQTSNNKREGGWRIRFAIAAVVIMSNQLSGVNAILFYAKQLFSKITKGDTHSSQNIIVLLSVMQVLAVLISTEIIDKMGRKNMILRGQGSLIGLLFCIFVSNNWLPKILTE
jgi:MFS family permease